MKGRKRRKEIRRMIRPFSGTGMKNNSDRWITVNSLEEMDKEEKNWVNTKIKIQQMAVEATWSRMKKYYKMPQKCIEFPLIESIKEGCLLDCWTKRGYEWEEYCEKMIAVKWEKDKVYYNQITPLKFKPAK